MTSEISGLLIICLMGVFGGFIYSLQKGQMVLPHRENKNSINLGFIANCLFGIAGSIVIFMVIPGDFKFGALDTTQYVKFLATALLGGWGGLQIIERAFSNTLSSIERKMKEREELEKLSAKTQEELSLYMNSSTSARISEREIQDKLANCLPTTRSAILSEAQKVRSETWNSNKPKMERTIPIFEALADVAAPEEQSHQTFGQLGFALKDQTNPNYMEAKDNLTKAINLRDLQRATGFVWYEFNRAICNIHLDANFKREAPSENNLREQIIADLRTAFADALLLERLEKNASLSGGDADIFAIKKWLDANNVSGAAIGIGWLDGAA